MPSESNSVTYLDQENCIGLIL